MTLNNIGRIFTKRSLIVFFFNLTAAFLMSALPHFNIQQSLANPLPSVPDKIEEIRPKLEQKENTFELKTSFLPQVQAGSKYEEAVAYGVVDLDTGEVIAQKNFSKRLPIASLTKIMTAVVSLDLASPEEEFIVSEKAASQIPTKVMLGTGEKYSLEELLHSLLLSSANDSAQVIKEGIDSKYGEEVFIRAMNLKAKVIGLKNSNFTNPQGFDNPDHYSSVEDLSILSKYALEYYPLLLRIVEKDIADYTRGWSDKRFYFQNWNGLIGVYPGVYGIKIGNTEDAGHTSVVISQREGKKMLAVVLGAPGVLQRDLWASRLLDLGFEQVAGLMAVDLSEEDLKNKYAAWVYFE